jgi:tetratricopeptide (TPR) repeat protein
MSRWVMAALLACAISLSAQNIPPPKPPEPPPAPTPAPEPKPDKPDSDALKRERPKPSVSKDPKEEVPPEEDTSLATENITFNPLEAQKCVTVGNEYYKKGNYRAASRRFKLATRYDDSNADAWLRLGEASEKVKDSETEKEAFTKYLAAAPDAKNAAEIRKKLEKLK